MRLDRHFVRLDDVALGTDFRNCPNSEHLVLTSANPLVQQAFDAFTLQYILLWLQI
jgi:hypothetical protein